MFLGFINVGIRVHGFGTWSLRDQVFVFIVYARINLRVIHLEFMTLEFMLCLGVYNLWVSGFKKLNE